MLKVGLTGGIGAGKTICASIFESIGIAIYNSDIRAKLIMTENDELVSNIKSIFGTDSYLDDGQLNRKYLASVIFSDQSKLTAMNQAVHPAVRKDFMDWCALHSEEDYIIQESALLFETGSFKSFDKIIVVSADDAIRIKRVMKRDKVDQDAVQSRIDKQLPQEDKIKSANFVINNNGDESLVRQVIDIHLQLIDIAQSNKKQDHR